MTSSGDRVLSIDSPINDETVTNLTQGVDNIHTDVENVVGGVGNDASHQTAGIGRITHCEP